MTLYIAVFMKFGARKGLFCEVRFALLHFCLLDIVAAMEFPDSNLLKLSVVEMAEKLKSDNPQVLSAFGMDLMHLANGKLAKDQPLNVVPGSGEVLPLPEEERTQARALASRLSSEIAAFKEGEIIKKLLKQFLEADEIELSQGAINMDGLAYSSGLVLCWLWAHKPVAKLTLQLCDKKTLVNRLAFCMKQSCKSGPPYGLVHIYPSL
jgi:hypothetical protein